MDIIPPAPQAVLDFPFFFGDRIAQLLFEKLPSCELCPKETLGGSDRGEGGFGSTGVA